MKLQRLGEIQLRQAQEVAHHLRLAHLGQALQPARGRGSRRSGSEQPGDSKCAPHR